MNLALRKIYYPLINIRERTSLFPLEFYYYDIFSHAHTRITILVKISL